VTQIEIVSDHHVEQIAGDGDLFDWICKLTVPYPLADRTD